ncbi:MAG: GNAT family N-acetyltransferase [Maricaulaceae bacterium]
MDDWTISIIRPADISDKERQYWAELQSQNIELQNPFFTWEYVNAIAAYRPDVRVMVVNRNGEGRAFLPMNIKSGHARPAGAPLCDYQMLIAAPDFDLNLKDIMRAGQVRAFRFNGLIDPNEMFPTASEDKTRFRVDLRQGFEDYQASLAKKGRQSLRRTRRRREDAESQFGTVRVEHGTASSDDIKQLFKWKSEQFIRTRKYNVLSQRWVYEFLLHIASLNHGDFGGFVSKLYFGQKLVAVHLNVRYKGYVNGWIISFDPEYRDYSPGLILFEDCFRNHEKLGIEIYDFSTGESQYKRHLSNLNGVASAGFETTSGLKAVLYKAYNKMELANPHITSGKYSNATTRVRRRYQQISACETTWHGRMKVLLKTAMHTG